MVCWNISQNGAQQKHTLNKIDPFIYYKGTNKKKITKLDSTDLSCISIHSPSPSIDAYIKDGSTSIFKKLVMIMGCW